MPTNKVYESSGLIAVLGLVALLVGFIVRLVLPAIRYTAWALLLLGVILLATAFILNWRRVGSALTGRRGRFSTGTTVMASIFIGITLIVNTISIGNYQRFDLTVLSQFTITSQTKDVLSKLETPVRALQFFVPNDPYGIGSYAANLLEEYQNYTDQLSVKTIDPDEHPDQARQYGIQMYPTVVFETERGRRLVLPQDILQMETDQQGNPQIVGVEAEHAFTSAILEVSGTVQKKVYFLSGHGESSIYANYSNARENLLDNLYQVDTLDLTWNSSIPDDCATLIVAGPQELIPSKELEVIEQYLESGRPALFMLNPNSPKEINQFLAKWGIRLGDGTVIDPSSYVAPSLDSPSVPSTRNSLGLPTIYFPGATAIMPDPEYEPTATMTEQGEISPIVWKSQNSQIEMYRLIWTSQDSWLETNFSSLEKPKFDDGTEVKGPLALGFLIFTPPSADNTEGQGTALIVIGDSDFAANPHFYNGNNGDFFINSVNLLTEGTELITVERKILPFRRLIVGPEITRFINYSSIGLLPLLVLAIGSIVWWRRR